MDFPIENITVPISISHNKKFFIKMSAYNVNNTNIDVIVELSQGKYLKQKLQLRFPFDEVLANKTNVRTVLFSACIKAQKRVQDAAIKVARVVLESRRTFEPRLIGVVGNSLTYSGRGFSGFRVDV